MNEESKNYFCLESSIKSFIRTLDSIKEVVEERINNNNSAKDDEILDLVTLFQCAEEKVKEIKLIINKLEEKVDG